MARLSYYTRKIQRAVDYGTLKEKTRRKVINSIYTPAYVAARYPMLSGVDRTLEMRRGFADHREDPAAQQITTETAERVIEAYAAAQDDQKDAPRELVVRGLWEEWISVNYGPLIHVLQSRDAEALAKMLNNFEREDFAVGTGVCHQDVLHAEYGLWSAPYVRTLWTTYRDKALYGGVDPASVTHPMIGNPAGIEFNGSVIPVDVWRHIYNANEISAILSDLPGSTMLEIGGGFGSQAYQTIKAAAPSLYRLYDLPEVAAIAGAFLITALPDKRTALYGEPAEEADIIVHPHFVIQEVADDSVDVVFNSNSFSEMDGVTAGYYLSVVNRCCRRYFKHINHEVRLAFGGVNGSSVNLLGSEIIPDPTRFKRLFKRPRFFARPEDVSYPSNSYLYERLQPSSELVDRLSSGSGFLIV